LRSQGVAHMPPEKITCQHGFVTRKYLTRIGHIAMGPAGCNGPAGIRAFTTLR
jgi:hypothetical protein